MTANSIAVCSKQCTKCAQTLPIENFPRDNQKPDGHKPRCKPCIRAQSRGYYALNRAVILERQRESYAVSPERQRTYHQEWYSKNKDEKLAKNRLWKAENREAYAEQQKLYVERNRGASNQRRREWAKRNPEKRAALMRHHNATRRAATKSGASPATVERWLSGQAQVCFYCGSCCAGAFEIDHFIPLARGGPHEVENLRVACRPCNRRKSSRDPHEFIRSL